jgi:hypothetical protein
MQLEDVLDYTALQDHGFLVPVAAGVRRHHRSVGVGHHYVGDHVHFGQVGVLAVVLSQLLQAFRVLNQVEQELALATLVAMRKLHEIVQDVKYAVEVWVVDL